MTKPNKNDKTMQSEASDRRADRLAEEINILRLEGVLFSFDPREARQHNGKLKFVDTLKKPVTIDINPNYGRPSVTAYKTLQAIFLKVAEQGCTLTENGYCIHESWIYFTWRELAYLTGRAWGTSASEQLYNAVMQLRRTAISAALYDKTTDTYEVSDFEVLSQANFEVHDKKIVSFAVELNSKIIDSYNKRHIAIFNLQRLSELDTIGLVLYKRIFFHLSNIVTEKDLAFFKRAGKWPETFRLRKDYEAICSEWLGGLKPRRHKSDIVREIQQDGRGKKPLKRKDQLGPHFEKLNATTLTQRCEVEKNVKGTGFNIVFYPGQGFYEDYRTYYLREAKPARVAQIADMREIKALELVAEFHRQLEHTHNKFEDHEKKSATELLSTYTEVDIRDLISFGITEARKTGFEMLFFGALEKKYLSRWAADRSRRAKRAKREEFAAQCPFCKGGGVLELKDLGSGRFIARPCPHRIEAITRLEDELKAYRI